MSDASALQLKIGGQVYGGWKSIELTRSIDTMAGAFEVETTDRWPGQPDQWAIKTGDAAIFLVDGELELTGWVDEVEPEIDKDHHLIRVRGRGRTGDLVDCSALNSPGHWIGRKLEQIVADLCAPFGIKVTASADTGAAFAHFAIQQGEAVKDAIDRLVQQRGVLPIETPSGDLEIASPAATRAAGQLALGVNCWGKAKHSALERFSQYVVKGQRQGNDHDHGTTVAQVTGQASDPQVTRYRPLMIMAEDQATGISAQMRATFAATVRAGRAQSGELTTPGFRDAAGALWRQNTVVPVSAADLGLTDDLLINQVRLLAGDKGSLTEIHVTRPEAYSLGEVKGAGLSRLDNSSAGRGRKGRKGRGSKGPGLSALANLPS